MLGWNHDVGYEFSKKQQEHPDIGADMLSAVFGSIVPKAQDDIAYQAIKNHGRYTQHKTVEWKILNMADMLIDSKGNEVAVTQRLEDIKERYGERSDQYLTACDICYQIGLTAVNLAPDCGI